MTATSDRSVKALETTLDVLQTLRSEEPISLAGLDAKLDFAKSTLHAHLKTLKRAGFVVENEGEYRIGLRFLEYGIFARNQRELFYPTTDVVDTLAEETGERAWCVVRQGTKAVYLYGAGGSQSVTTREEVGRFGDLHALAAGKAILAHLPEEAVSEILDQTTLERKTEHTITDPDELLDELERIRERGVAFNRQESMSGVNAIGAPIRDLDEGVHGAISVGGPANRLTDERLKGKLTDLILGAANEVEIHLHHR